MMMVAALGWMLGAPAAAESIPGVVNVLDFGAVGDGETDCSEAFQNAIDKVAETGGIVEIPAGHFRITQSIHIRDSVALRGVNVSPASIRPLKGTVIFATVGRDDEDGPALFEMYDATTIQGLTIYYPEQTTDDIRPYSWTIYMNGNDCTVENVTFINSYQGIKTGPSRIEGLPLNTVRHRIRSVVGTVLRRGIFVDFCTDIGRIDNVQFHCHWWSDPATNGDWDPVFKYMFENLEAFIFGRTDWSYVTNCFVFPANIGYRFIETEYGASNGHMTGCGADATHTAVQVDAIQPMGWLITGGQFVSFDGEDPTQIRVKDTNREGNVRFVNASFWGPAARIADIAGTGYISFSDCYFADWIEDIPDKPLIRVESGRIQLNNCSFTTLPNRPEERVHIELGPNVANAIVRGNNGLHGVRIVDHTDGRAIIADNQPFQEPAQE